jgi:hypothetical protein
VVALALFAAFDALRSSSESSAASAEGNHSSAFSERNRLDGKSLAHITATSERLDLVLSALVNCRVYHDPEDQAVCTSDKLRKPFDAA